MSYKHRPADCADNALKFTLPYPPSVNSYWKRTKRGMMRSKEATAYINAVGWTVKSILKDLPLGGIEGRLSVEIKIYPPDKRRRDIDNIAKATLDAMQYAGIYQDDNQIDRLTLIRMPGVGGYLEVNISKISV